MRHRAEHGRHERRPRVPLRSYLITALALCAAVVASAGLAGIFPAHAADVPAVAAAGLDREAAFEPAVPDLAAQTSELRSATQARVARAVLAKARAAAVLAAHTYTVRAGDSLSNVAAKHCGAGRDWTGIYAASRAHGWTARNANVLDAGQHLYLSCAYDASQLRFAPPPAPAPVRAVVAVATASTGHGYQAPAARAYRAPVVYRAPVAAGTYSYAGLESLWVSAGGPSWAAPHAAEIAECESGGRTDAHNPSGASGLWQILGSVVPGDLYNAYTNALNAVSKFRASGDTFAQWVCQ